MPAAPVLLNELLPDVAVPCVTPAPDAAPDPAVAETELVAMPEDEFWDLVGVLGGSSDPAGFEALTDTLAKTDLDTAIAFQARLTLALHALDSGCRAEWYRVNEPMQMGFVSDDVFLYSRCDTVVAGREVWQDAVDTDTLPWGTVDPTTGNGEFLLYVAVDAADRMGTPLEEYFDAQFASYTLSFETGSNPLGWPE